MPHGLLEEHLLATVISRATSVSWQREPLFVDEFDQCSLNLRERGFPKSIRFRADYSKAAKSRHHLPTQLLVSLHLTSDVPILLIERLGNSRFDRKEAFGTMADEQPRESSVDESSLRLVGFVRACFRGGGFSIATALSQSSFVQPCADLVQSDKLPEVRVESTLAEADKVVFEHMDRLTRLRNLSAHPTNDMLIGARIRYIGVS